MSTYGSNPNGTSSTSGWTGSGCTVTATADGLRVTNSGTATGRYVRYNQTLTTSTKDLVLSGLKLRRNTAASAAPSTVYIKDPDNSGISYKSIVVSSSAGPGNFPLGAFVTASNCAFTSYGPDRTYLDIEFDGGAPIDFTITHATFYDAADNPAQIAIDSNDTNWTPVQVDNTLVLKLTPSTTTNELVYRTSVNWGDGTASTAYAADASPSHTYAAPGSYVVTRTCYPSYGDGFATASVSVPQTITVPAGTFQADFNTEINYLGLSVDASPSVCPSVDTITGYAWNWGDGTSATGKLQAHTYAQPGDYVVSLTITTTSSQRTNTTTKTVTATTPVNPANYFIVNKNLLTVTFAPSIVNGTSYAWSFGDGQTSTAQAPTYIYPVPGTYTVTLTVNGTQTTSQSVTVSDTFKAFKPAEALRLEVAVPPAAGVIYNRLKNPDGVRGAWGWQTPLSGSTVIGSSTSDQPKDKAVSGSKLIYTSSGAGTQVLQTAPVAVTAGQYVGAQFVCTYVDGYYRATVDALSSTGAVLGSSATTGYLGALGTAQRTVGYLLPTGTVAARVRINHYSTTSAGTPASGAILQLRHVMLVTAATAALTDAVPYAEAENWQNVLGSTTTMNIDREALNVGTFTATVANSALDPATSSTIRPGQAIRLRAAVPDESGNVVWKNVYAGTLTDAKVAYVGKTRITPKSTRITLAATDAITRLAQDNEPRGVALISELPELLESTTVPYEINGQSGQVPTANVVAYNENASVLDQVAITRDTRSGYAYVSRNNVLVVRDPQSMPTVAVGVVDETTYSDIDATFDTSTCMNSITIKWLRYTPGVAESTPGAGDGVDSQTEEILYPPVEDAASIATWGFHPATFTMQGIENTTTIAAKAAAILSANAVPSRHINSVTIPIRYVEDIHEGKALLDLYDLVQLAYTRTSTSEAARVTGIKHTISPSGWYVTLEFSQNGAVAAPQFTPSPPPVTDTAAPTGGSAATTTFTPAGGIAATNVQAAIQELDTEKADKTAVPRIQRGTKSASSTTASVTKATAVVFPVAFTTIPTVMVSADTSAPEKISLGASDITLTGFNIQHYRTNTTATTVNWLAVGT